MGLIISDTIIMAEPMNSIEIPQPVITVTVGIYNDLGLDEVKPYWGLTFKVQNGLYSSRYAINDVDHVTESEWNSFLTSEVKDIKMEISKIAECGQLRKSYKNGVYVASLYMDGLDDAACTLEAPWAPFAEALRGAIEEVRLNPMLSFAPERVKTKKSSDVRLGGGAML